MMLDGLLLVIVAVGNLVFCVACAIGCGVGAYCVVKALRTRKSLSDDAWARQKILVVMWMLLIPVFAISAYRFAVSFLRLW